MNVYSTGESEAILGKFLKDRRDEYVVAMKVGNRLAQQSNRTGLSRKHVLEQIDRRLERFRADYLNLDQVTAWTSTHLDRGGSQGARWPRRCGEGPVLGARDQSPTGVVNPL